MGGFYEYFVLYKPCGYLSQFTPDHPGQKTLAELYPFPPEVYAVGRLDQDSEGLLLLTNDKSLNQFLLDPRHGHWRTYWVQVEGFPDQTALQKLATGVTIKVAGQLHNTRPCHVKIIPNPDVPPRTPPIRYRVHIPDTWVELKLQEGKNRQVRRMLAAVGYPVLRLVRVALEDLQLELHKSGAVRKYDRAEIYNLLKLNRNY